MPRTDDPSADEHRADEHGVEELFRIRYLEMVRLAGLLGADDPEDIAQEAFIRTVGCWPTPPCRPAGRPR